jgi:hypothetical protein
MARVRVKIRVNFWLVLVLGSLRCSIWLGLELRFGFGLEFLDKHFG